MKHSFISPRPKVLLSSELKLVLFFFFITIVMLFSTYLFLIYKTYDFKGDQVELVQKQADLKKSLIEIERQIDIINKEVKVAEQVSTDNTVMKESIRNLFDLVPNEITLDRAELDNTSLILYGITPNKDTYSYMLQAPLRSIFHRTYTSFYPSENGWYRFVSTNYLEEEKNDEEIE